jgi:hypothetical protein
VYSVKFGDFMRKQALLFIINELLPYKKDDAKIVNLRIRKRPTIWIREPFVRTTN